MDNMKYADLVKPLSIGRVDLRGEAMRGQRGTGNANQLIWLNGKDHLKGINLNFTWGFYNGVGDWRTDLGPHVHPYPECLVFVGLDTSDINYLGAEIEIELGEEREIYTFSKPTVVVLPTGLPHCPIRTKSVDSPRGFGFYLISLGAQPETTWLGAGLTAEEVTLMQEGAAGIGMKMSVQEDKPKPLSTKPAKNTERKYAHLVKTMTPTIGPNGPAPEGMLGKSIPADEMFERGPGNADQLIWMYGKDLEGIELSFTWGFYSSPGIWHKERGAHVHPSADECLVFVGLDPDNIDYLGAEVEIDIGKEHERHVFNRPSVVILPAGVPHLPLVTRLVDKPYGFYAISLDAGHVAPFID